MITLSIILAITASINATILAGSRIYYAMAYDGIFLAPFKRLHPFYNTPHLSILIQMLLASLLVFIGTFTQLLSYVVFIMLLTSVATGIAHLVLRRRNPALQRPYRTWGYPVIPLVFIGFYMVIAIQIAYARPLTSIAGLCIALSGLPFYFRQYKKLRRGRE